MQLKNEAAIVFFDVVGGPIVFFHQHTYAKHFR